MHVGVFQTLPGRLGALQGPSGASRASNRLQTAPEGLELNSRLKFHAGWSGWTRPPTMAGGGGGRPRLSSVPGFPEVASAKPES